MNYNQAKKIISDARPESNITAAFELPSGFLFSLKPKSWGKDEYVLDGFFRVDDSGKVHEYSPVMDLDEFGYAMDHHIE